MSGLTSTARPGTAKTRECILGKPHPPEARALDHYLHTAEKRIAVKFEGSAVDARSLARAIQSTFDASRVGLGAVFIQGFSMNPSDKWHVGEPRITITQKRH